MAAFQGKQYLDISMSRPQRKNVSLVINLLKAEQAHVALRHTGESWKDVFTENSAHRCESLFLHIGILDPEFIYSKE